MATVVFEALDSAGEQERFERAAKREFGLSGEEFSELMDADELESLNEPDAAMAVAMLRPR